MKLPTSIRGRLFLWYATSLLSITAFFYLAVHILTLPYGNILFFVLLLALALEGFYIIRKMTDTLTTLSSRIKTITSESLSEKITGIESEDEIGELARSFNQLLDRLYEAFKRERQFIGDVAHEVKTPLAAQRTTIEIALTRDRSKEEYRRALQESLIDNNQLSTTLKNILDLAWSEADSARGQFEDFNLSEVVKDLQDLGTKMAVKKQISIKGNVEPNIIAFGKKDKFERALINLVDNAIKYTPEKGTVAITLKKSRGQAQFEVKDTGSGISEKDLPHVFERFYRGSKTDKTFGSGLGLSITQAIISAHRGDIRAKSQIGRGSEFTVHLPLASS